MNKTLTIITAVAVAFMVGYCSRPKPTESVLVKTDTIYQDTGTHSVSIVPKPYKVTDSIPYYIYQNIDTGAILADFFLVREYDSTLVNDTSLYIHFFSKVWRNEIVVFKIDYSNRRPTIVQTYQPEPKPSRIEVMAGVGVFRFMDQYILSVSGGIGNDRGLILIQTNPKNKYYSLSIMRKF